MKSAPIHVAVVGATGVVGREMLRVLFERDFPASRIVPMASAASVGKEVLYGEKNLRVVVATATSFSGIDVALMSPGADASRALAPLAARAGALVIDNSSAFRMDEDVPLIVPEVNASALVSRPARGIIANPNCSTIQLVVALAPLAREASLLRVVVSTYQAVSGAGRGGMDELGEQVTALFAGREIVSKTFARRIAFNCIPQIDAFADDGDTREEHKMRRETRKILGDDALGFTATCVRVPVFNGHALSINAQFARALSAERARELLKEAPGVLLDDDVRAGAFPTQVDAEGQDATLVGRIRRDDSVPFGLNLWCVADNLRKGAATNAVQIAEAALSRGLLRA